MHLYSDFNPSNRDAKIDQLGIGQCLESQKIANELPIHTIFVSPLRRALMTAYYVYKDHPNFASIEFILLPQLRESLNIISDIPSNIDEVIEEFKELIPQLHIVELSPLSNPPLHLSLTLLPLVFTPIDASLIDLRKSREHWFLDDYLSNIISFKHICTKQHNIFSISTNRTSTPPLLPTNPAKPPYKTPPPASLIPSSPKIPFSPQISLFLAPDFTRIPTHQSQSLFPYCLKVRNERRSMHD
ncbi:unnamed protein product [Moneuplotes crassus]|uniref:Uncharacterized protein n=1 Tax=Euplotes crassus TaxID=5936 RepID=A0AAD1XCL0_EUPCR|nr:unnamed protein product [Moneuplotes crassus]